jgi:ABC-2 type transport system ATP-binding protein
LVNKGRKILDGSVNQVKQDFKENLFRIGANATADHLQSQLFDVVRHSQEEILLKLQPDATTNQVLSHFINSGVQVHAFNEVLPSLNEIFIKLVEGTPHARQFEAVA